MSVIFERYGFHFIQTSLTTSGGDNLFLVVKMRGRSTVEAPRLSVWEHSEDEYVEFINRHNIKCASVFLDDFSFLERCPGLEMLNIYPSFEAPNRVSYEPVYSMPALKALQPLTTYDYDKKRTVFDCSRLASAAKLEWFGASVKKEVKNLDALTGVKSLLLSSYIGERRNLEGLITSDRLDTLSLLLCGVESLDGLSSKAPLQVLELANCRALRSIDALYNVRDSLCGLVIDACNKIEDFSVLSSLHNLTRLSLTGTNTLQSLSFLDEMPNLKTLILDMSVSDGDLSYCDRLDHTAIVRGRRNFNRKNDQFPKKKRPYVILGDEGVNDVWRRNVVS